MVDLEHITDNFWRIYKRAGESIEAGDHRKALSALIEIDDQTLPPELVPLLFGRRGIAYAGLTGGIDFQCALHHLTSAIDLVEKNPNQYDSKRMEAELSEWKSSVEKMFKQAEFEETIADSDEAIKLNPKDATAYLKRGCAKYYLDQSEAAIADANKAIELDPKYAGGYYYRGYAKMAGLEQFEAAIADFNEAIKLDPKCVAAYTDRSRAKGELRQFEATIADANKAIELDPKYADAYGYRGCAKVRLGQFEAAIADANKAIELDPKCATAYGCRGEAKLELRQLDDAFADFTKAIKLHSKEDRFYVYSCRGSIHEQRGETKKAKTDYHLVLQQLEQTPEDELDRKSIKHLIRVTQGLTRLGKDLSAKVQKYQAMAEQRRYSFT
ncbi:tetratricopeptide repeat protein [Candidatus Woesearchaeota archaeon]|nr:tetratricopeptide repeat protein [Candidatus Woesearchaeota archaeon]